jgi:hypothetical protein
MTANAVEWDAQDLPAGIYMIRFQAGGREWSKRVLLLK